MEIYIEPIIDILGIFCLLFIITFILFSILGFIFQVEIMWKDYKIRSENNETKNNDTKCM